MISPLLESILTDHPHFRHNPKKEDRTEADPDERHLKKTPDGIKKGDIHLTPLLNSPHDKQGLRNLLEVRQTLKESQFLRP